MAFRSWISSVRLRCITAPRRKDRCELRLRHDTAPAPRTLAYQSESLRSRFEVARDAKIYQLHDADISDHYI